MSTQKVVVEHTGNSFPFLGILALIFITLKLTGHITWSWWWVLAPIWIPVSIVFGLLLFLLVLAVAIAGWQALTSSRNKR